MSTDNDYDFGFSFEEEESIMKQTVIAPTANTDQIKVLESKIQSLLDAQEQALNNAYVAALEEKHKATLKELEGLILPLLYNLKKNPEKPIINWPNREPIINKQIEKILAVTRG